MSRFLHLAKTCTKAITKLYDAVPTASPISAASIATPPAVTYRCRATVATSTTHTDCAGTLTIGSDTLTFTTSGQVKICTTNITASTKPSISYSGLDSKITIECIGTGGAPIMAETLTAIDIKFKDETEYYSQAIGGFVKRPAQCVTDETASCINDVIRYNGIDYPIKAIHAKRDRLGIERRRVLQF